MTQEEKELLLRDLSARLTYGVIVNYKESEYDFHNWKIDSLHTPTYSESGILIDTDYEGWISFTEYKGCGMSTGSRPLHIEKNLPFLRSMSSMTEEEKKDILQSINIHGDIDNEGNLLLGVECDILTLKVCKKYLGELNKRMFDIYHMIEKGLALEAPDGMYEQRYKEA